MIILDAACMGTRREAHAYLAEMLEFPEYYGRNLDALHDCLEELTDTEVTFVNTEEAGPYFEKVLRVFRDTARRGDGLTIAE